MTPVATPVDSTDAVSSDSSLTEKPATPQFFISTFYHFVAIPDPEAFKKELQEKAQELLVKGLIIIGHEGFNTTSSALSPEALEAWKTFFKTRFQLRELNNKDSVCDKPPFLRFTVKFRPEIVTTGRTDLHLDSARVGHNAHLSPEEWDRVLKDERDQVVLIDTRNWYEYNIGTFKNALNPNIEKFTEFPKYFEQQNIEKDQKILIFCTGGIRCEKGILELQEKGYKNVYQLEGGILKYLEKKPHEEFEGECFVFDNRVAVDQELRPSQTYKFCPHCGQPAKLHKECVRCDSPYQICEACAQIEVKKDTCSKNCAHQWSVRPNKKGARQEAPYERELQKWKQRSPFVIRR
ncbi:MAG: rhodanese-related sulfurtransferase [Bdellovibrionales bacterium]